MPAGGETSLPHGEMGQSPLEARTRGRRRARTGLRERIEVNALRLLVLLSGLAVWEYLPKTPWLRDSSPVFNPFFVSSPTRVFHRLVDVATGAHGQPQIWPFLWDTLKGTFLGVGIGLVLGALFGLLLSNSTRSQRVLSPFITFANATPRIALVPIFVIIAGPTLTASVATAVAVVFFIVLYNAYAGGISVPLQAVQNARLLGATSWEVMRHVRLPYVLVWTFTSLPNAISFGLVAVVTAEILTGRLGMGRLLSNSIAAVDSTATFTVVVTLSIVGVILVVVSEALQRRFLHWWERSD
jgi:NitT/TauT family transport system permease protein